MASLPEPVVAALIRTDAAPAGVPAAIVFTTKVPSATLGRLGHNEVVMSGPKVSKVHARILLKSHRRRGTEDGMGVLRLFIKDTSSFGTHVNGCKLGTERWTMLVEDDIIGLRQPDCYDDSRCQGEYRVQYRFPPIYLELNLSRSKRDADCIDAICTNAAGAKKAKLEVTIQDSGAHLYRGILKQICPQIGQTMNLVLPDGRLLEGALCNSAVSSLLPVDSADFVTNGEPTATHDADGEDQLERDEVSQPVAKADEANALADEPLEEATELEVADYSVDKEDDPIADDAVEPARADGTA